MSGELRICFGQSFKIRFFIFWICEIVIQPVFHFRAPFFTYIGDQSFLEPISEIEEYGVLDNLLQIISMKHCIDIHSSDSLAELRAKIIVVSIEIEDDFVFNNFCNSAFADKLFLHAEVALFHVGEIEINDKLNLIIHLMLKDILDVGIVEFCQLDDSMGYFTAFAIPVGDEIFGFVHIPLVKIIMVLDPVFSEFGIDGLSL